MRLTLLLRRTCCTGGRRNARSGRATDAVGDTHDGIGDRTRRDGARGLGRD
jgi:hypothetical protein